MKWKYPIVAGLAASLLISAGCTITTEKSRDELQAENAAMMHIMTANRDATQGRDADRAEVNRLLELMGLWRGTQAGQCGNPNGCWQQQPVIQPMPQQPQQPIIVMPGQPSTQPVPQQPIIIVPGDGASTQPVAPQQPVIVIPSPNPPSVQPVPEAPISIQPVPHDPMSIQPVPQPQYCMWTCDQISGRCGYSCTTTGGPITYPTQPPEGQPEDNPVENPQFHEGKG